MEPFRATLRQHYQLKGNHLLVLEEYSGDVSPGDHLTVALPGGGSLEFRVHDLAWGSAFNASAPPLTLIVKDLGANPPPLTGAEISPVED
jgi:hypothetical protein